MLNRSIIKRFVLFFILGIINFLSTQYNIMPTVLNVTIFIAQVCLIVTIIFVMLKEHCPEESIKPYNARYLNMRSNTKWESRPVCSKRLTKMDLYISIGGLPITIATIYGLTFVYNQVLFFPVLFILFMLIYLVVGRYLFIGYVDRKTRYRICDDKLLVIRKFVKNTKIYELEVSSVKNIVCEKKNDGLVNIYFNVPNNFAGNIWRPYAHLGVPFISNIFFGFFNVQMTSDLMSILEENVNSDVKIVNI